MGQAVNAVIYCNESGPDWTRLLRLAVPSPPVTVTLKERELQLRYPRQQASPRQRARHAPDEVSETAARGRTLSRGKMNHPLRQPINQSINHNLLVTHRCTQ